MVSEHGLRFLITLWFCWSTLVFCQEIKHADSADSGENGIINFINEQGNGRSTKTVMVAPGLRNQKGSGVVSVQKAMFTTQNGVQKAQQGLQIAEQAVTLGIQAAQQGIALGVQAATQGIQAAATAASAAMSAIPAGK